MLHRYVGPDATDPSRNDMAIPRVPSANPRGENRFPSQNCVRMLIFSTQKSSKKGEAKTPMKLPYGLAKNVSVWLTAWHLKPSGRKALILLILSTHRCRFRLCGPDLLHHTTDCLSNRQEVDTGLAEARVKWLQNRQLLRSFQSSFLSAQIPLPLKPKDPVLILDVNFVGSPWFGHCASSQ